MIVFLLLVGRRRTGALLFALGRSRMLHRPRSLLAILRCSSVGILGSGTLAAVSSPLQCPPQRAEPRRADGLARGSVAPRRFHGPRGRAAPPVDCGIQRPARPVRRDSIGTIDPDGIRHGDEQRWLRAAVAQRSAQVQSGARAAGARAVSTPPVARTRNGCGNGFPSSCRVRRPPLEYRDLERMNTMARSRPGTRT